MMKKTMKDLSKLEKKIGIRFKNKKLLTQALTHRSYLNENPKLGYEDNERLEFLGDAVLELVVTKYLYQNYLESEGELTNYRASLVNASMLSSMAYELGLNDFIYLSKGEAKDSQSKARQFILANTFEALIGAIYLDQGMSKTKKFIEKKLLNKLSYILKHQLYRDPKSLFQEQAQERVNITPSYKVLKEIGPDHLKQFTIGVYLNKELVATGIGSSKQEAQVEAAKKALEIKGW